MPPADPEPVPRLSVLDRLLDDTPGASQDPLQGGPSARAVLAQHRDSVRRDLQDLLNTRQRLLQWPAELEELDDSLLEYGLPDLTGANLGSEAARNAFLREMERTIRRCDRRFRRVSAQRVESSDGLDRTLRFRIEATLAVETGQETAVWDFQLEPVTRRLR